MLSRAIRDRVLGLPLYREAPSLHTYIGAIEGEVATDGIVEAALASGRRVFCPRVVRGPDRLESYEIRSLDELIPGPRGLREPDPARARRVAEEEIGLVLVPGIAFDRRGHRIGFGAGFYDRFLGALGAPTVGLAFSLQIVHRVPCAKRDVPADWIVTEEETIDCRSTRVSLGTNR